MKMICNKMKIVQIWACANALNCAHIQLLVHRGFWLSADPDNFVRYFRLRNVFFVSMKNLLYLLNYFVVVCRMHQNVPIAEWRVSICSS